MVNSTTKIDWEAAARNTGSIQDWYKSIQVKDPNLKNVDVVDYMKNDQSGYNYQKAIEYGDLPQLTEHGDRRWISDNPDYWKIRVPIIDDNIKGLFASMETSGDISGDYLQLKKSTFRDLKNRKLIPNEITWQQTKKYPQIYDQVAQIYLDDLMKTFKIPTVQDASLWSLYPAGYKKYKGKIENIPEDIKSGTPGKSLKQVMYQRITALQKYIKEQNARIASTATNTTGTVASATAPK